MSKTYVDIEAVNEVLADVKDCEDKVYALALLEWAIEKRTISEQEIQADERQKFKEWFKKSDYHLCYSDTIDKVMEEYEKEKKNEWR